tara:strand:+ start:687 stop:887 length:201 start_codon:yes stop_codon:yes gene_type:complete
LIKSEVSLVRIYGPELIEFSAIYDILSSLSCLYIMIQSPVVSLFKTAEAGLWLIKFIDIKYLLQEN